jgi:dienelactone hydrolase
LLLFLESTFIMKRLRILYLSLLTLACGIVSMHAGFADTPSWDQLKTAYDYDIKTALSVKTETKEDADYYVEHISFTNIKGESVPGIFVRPKAEGTYPCVLLLHGLFSNKETMNRSFGRELAAKGIASLALDANRHGERRKADAQPSIQPAVFAEMVRTTVVDYRQALDYLKTRKDVDSKSIGLLGYSMGAMMGSILSGVDERVKASVLCVGGDPVKAMVAGLPENLRKEADFVSPSNYASHISPRPVMFINGKQDTVVNEQASKVLHEAAKDPKEIIWVEAGHILPAEATGKGIAWLVEKLGRK